MSKGIDIPIDNLKTVFAAYLWKSFSTSWYGRCNRNYRDDNLVPEVLTSGTDYRDVLLDDTKDSICFFDVAPERTETEADVDIYFAVKLNKLYSTITERATEYAISDVLKWIHLSEYFTAINISTGYEAWSDWAMVKKEDNMQPFFLFKIKTNVKYLITC